MIKICYIIGQLNIGGAQRQLYELVKGINKEKFQPSVISLSEGGYWSGEIQRLGIQVIELTRLKNREFRRLFKLIKLLKKIKPEIVHTFSFPANSYGRIASIITKVPIIIASERNISEIGKDKNLYIIIIDRLLALFSHGIICNSYKAADKLKKYHFNRKNIFTVHNGINIINFLNKINCNRKNNSILDASSSHIIGTIGRLYPQKNHKLFLDMAKSLLDMSHNGGMKFLIVGDGWLRNELEDYARHLRIDDSVSFTGERTDVPELLQSMDIFVMTSLYEGLSNTIMEAMLAGLPVVATDVGGNSELVINGETGFLCSPTDARTLAEKVIRLIHDKKEARKMGEKGKEKIINEFGIKKMVTLTENIYQKLLEKN